MALMERAIRFAKASWTSKKAALRWRTASWWPTGQLPKAWSRYRLRYGPRLWVARARAVELYREREPLVSVLIPTYNRAALLVDRAIASVRAQTYERLEIVVVGDGCTDATGEALRSVGDPRIRFHNRAGREVLPADPWHAWLVAGTAAANPALSLARGSWVAWLDDDDEFASDHVETLLGACLARRLEFAYGIMEMEVRPDVWKPVGSYPPHLGHICNASVLYATHLRFMTYDPEAWRLDEPGDWNLWKRMWGAGVRIGFVDRIVGRHYAERKQLASGR